MKTFLVVAVVAMLSGCYERTPIDRYHVRESNDIPGHVFDFHLEDGTRCVVWSGGNQNGSLDCDFRATPVEQGEPQVAVFRNGFAHKG